MHHITPSRHFDSAAQVEKQRRAAQITEIYRLFDANHDNDVVLEEFASLASIFEGSKMTRDKAKKVPTFRGIALADDDALITVTLKQ